MKFCSKGYLLTILYGQNLSISFLKTKRPLATIWPNKKEEEIWARWGHRVLLVTSKVVQNIDIILDTHSMEYVWQAIHMQQRLYLHNDDNEMAQIANKQLK